MSVDALQGHCQAVYDMTVAYTPRHQIRGSQGCAPAPSMAGMIPLAHVFSELFFLNLFTLSTLLVETSKREEGGGGELPP